ncbi:helix-turn-helix domain-containing protein [Azospira sp. APE16]|jgi:cytoskeleton protein RodZ|uniref:helix-turn-helix domain-containing protein n=1 Tax=Azospira sp. APE16 TaxID=3394231 RepID=UPI003A4D486B
MSELVQETLAEESPAAESRPEVSVGLVLRQARESRQMSVADVAQLLKISYRQVDALESDNWDALPGQTFVLGFIRNYARLLHLDATPLLQQIKAAQTPDNPNIVLPEASAASLPQPGQGKRRDLAAVAGAALMVGVAVAAYFLVPADFWQSAPEPEPVAETAAEAEPEQAFPPAAPAEGNSSEAAATGVPEQAPAAAVPPAAAAVAAPAPAAAAAPAAVAAPAPAPVTVSPPAPSGAVAAGQARFKFRFEQPSWVEVKDKSGQIVFSQLNPAGSEREVEGVPPFSLVVGNASHVKLTYKGRDVPLEPRSKDDVARVSLD